MRPSCSLLWSVLLLLSAGCGEPSPDRSAGRPEEVSPAAIPPASESASSAAALRRDLRDAERTIASLRGELEAIRREREAWLDANWRPDLPGSTGGVPSGHGRVTGTDEELNIVLVSVGSDDPVRVGVSMTVSRRGEPMSQSG